MRALRAAPQCAASRAPAGEPLPDPLAQAHCLPWSRIVVCYRQYRYTGGTGNNTYIIHSQGVRVLCLILFCFCICFVFSIMYCATLGPTDLWLRHVLSCSIPFPCVFFLSMPLTPLCSSLSQSVCILISRPLVPSLLRSSILVVGFIWFNRKF